MRFFKSGEKKADDTEARVSKRNSGLNISGRVPTIMDTVIDCNGAFEKTPQALIDKLEQGKLKVCTDVMPEIIVQKLIQGVLASTQASKKVQKMLEEDDK